MGKSLVIVEVSQKQAYIFSSNKLKENIANSAAIAYVTSSDYFEHCSPETYQREKNEVYCGGGHAVLEFDDHETAKGFIQKITWGAKQHYPKMELFATLYDCEGEPSPLSIAELIKKLEQKKSFRRASFEQGSFGVEEVDSRSRDIRLLSVKGVPSVDKPDFSTDHKTNMDIYPDGYEYALAFEELGGSKGESNFIAVVHIDGNGMGKRIEEMRKCHEKDSWEDYCSNVLKKFSVEMDADFKHTFREMCDVVDKNIIDGKLNNITLKKSKENIPYFPVRRVIMDGDDICFVTEGRIGIECARIFLEIISTKTDAVIEKPYSACAGVAIVHQKYPFYLAYKMAEDLCSNAKKFVANSTKVVEGVDASNVCAIDWHLEFGEVEEGISNIRKQYKTADDNQMELRPYVVSGPQVYLDRESARNYQNFKKVLDGLNGADAFARGKIKELRDYIRKGETAALNYLTANSIDDIALNSYSGIYKDIDLGKIGTGTSQDRSLLIQTTDGISRFILFDAIEIMDTFIPLKKETSI